MPQNVLKPQRDFECKYNVRLKVFPDCVKYTCFSSQVFNPHGVCKHKTYAQEKLEDDLKKASQKQVRNVLGEVRDDSLKRSRDKAYEIAYANDFNYFITFTLDKNKVNRYEPIEVMNKLKHWLKNAVQRREFKYILFPEYHKDGAIHFHGLCSGKLDLFDSEKYTKNNQKIFNCDNWGYGWSTVIELTDDYARIVNYVLKYITKDKHKIFGKFYLSGGKGLKRSVPTFYENKDFLSFQGSEYKIPGVPLGVKYRTEGF